MTDLNKLQGLHALSAGIRNIVKPLVKKKGIASEEVILNWEEIVGSDLSLGLRPERIRYPKGKDMNGTLLVKAKNGSYALLFEYRKEQTIERINRLFGYQAVKDVKVTQSCEKVKQEEELPAPKPDRELTEKENNFLESALSDVEDDELREALARLGKSVLKKEK